MGQDLFYPPNVGGWSEGRSWLGTRTVIARANFAHAMSEGQLWHPAEKPDFESLFNRYQSKSGNQTMTQWLTTLFWGTAPEAVVDLVDSKEKNNSIVLQLLTRLEHQLA